MQRTHDNELPPVLRALGEDLHTAMIAADRRREADAAAPARGRCRRGAARLLPRPAGVRRTLRAAAAAAVPARRLAIGGTLAAGATAAVLALGSTGNGPQDAFAGWTATPGAPAAGQLQQAQSACAQQKARLGSSEPTVADARGTGSLLIYPGSGSFTTCLTGSAPLGTAVSTRTLSGSPPAAGTIEAEGFTIGLAEDGQMFRDLSGQVGEGVSAVTLVLYGGGTVQASVSGGWFAAWWPGHWVGRQAVLSGSPQPSAAAIASVGASAVASVQVTTASGTSTQPLNAQNMNIQPTIGAPAPPTGQ